MKYHLLTQRVSDAFGTYDLECDIFELYNLVVDEYLECGDDPEDATTQDILEIYDASF